MTYVHGLFWAMSLDLHPLSVTLIDRDMPLAAIQVPAGFPSPAADDLEDTVDPFKWVIRHEHATFWWRVSGDSLEAEGILDGDLIAVDRAGRRRSGRIVLAVVDGQITVKKLAKRDGQWFLDPRARSDGYPTIPVTETTEIWGVVAGVVRRADIVVAAVGRAEMVKADWLKPGATVIDVGINRLPAGEGEERGRLVGDVDYGPASEVASAITPVPGGVGPMTIAVLLRNTLVAAYNHAGLDQPEGL
jgi:DNA polymerase V